MVSNTQIIGESPAATADTDATLAGMAPEPISVVTPDAPQPMDEGKAALDPTRFGDWEKNGRCIDF